MEYAKVIDGVVIKFPYSLEELRADNPQVSFPKSLSDELLAEYNCVSVHTGAVPTESILSHRVVRADAPTFTGTRWEISYIAVPHHLEAAAQNIRAERGIRIADTDWIVAKSYERGEGVPAEWANYRQALRDITAQDGFPYNVTWPDQP